MSCSDTITKSDFSPVESMNELSLTVDIPFSEMADSLIIKYHFLEKITETNWETVFDFETIEYAPRIIFEFSKIDSNFLPMNFTDYYFCFGIKTKNREVISDSIFTVDGNVKTKVISPKCIGCWECVSACDYDAIFQNANKAVIDLEKCVRCGKCITACNLDGNKAIEFYIK
jgi:ferredoxin